MRLKKKNCSLTSAQEKFCTNHLFKISKHVKGITNNMINLQRNLPKIVSLLSGRIITQCHNYSKLSTPTRKPKGEEKISNLLKHFKRTKRRNDLTDPTHPSKITYREINDFIQEYSQSHNLQVQTENIRNSLDIIKNFLPHQRNHDTILDNVKIRAMTSLGEGLAIVHKSMYAHNFTSDPEEILNQYTVLIIPKTVIGDNARVLLKMHHEFYAEGELIEVLNSKSKGSRRNDRLIVCEKFNECNGCQLQMLSYEDQLKYKQSVIQRAYKCFYPQIFNLFKEMDNFGIVNESPLQYSYRTKLTPHFAASNKVNQKLGFQHVNNRGRLDITNCPIATPEINDILQESRDNYIGKSTPLTQLTLRQSLRINQDTGAFKSVALEGQKKVITEKVEDFLFQYDSNCFFQNNNAILPSVLDYIRYHINQSDKTIDNLIDTYCGVGFFGIALSKSFNENTKIFGIELVEQAIKYANHNAKLNGLDPERVQFVSGDASNIFNNENFKKSGISGKNSVVIVDPSRKGSNESFLQQLLDFEPEIVVYVSCNVFSQARDLATFENLQQNTNVKYKVKDVMGFDFFPQTKHVESIAILEKV